MKKILPAFILSSLIFVLSACGLNTKKAIKESKQENSMNRKTHQTNNHEVRSSKNEKEKSIFTATLVEDAKRNDTVDHSIRFVLTQVTAIKDPEQMIAMMKNDGVILNVLDNQLADGLIENGLKSGDRIQFTLTGVPATTMSIPPQIAGNAVELVEKIAK